MENDRCPYRSPNKSCVYSSRVTQPLCSISAARADTLGVQEDPIATVGESTCGLHLQARQQRQEDGAESGHIQTRTGAVMTGCRWILKTTIEGGCSTRDWCKLVRR